MSASDIEISDDMFIITAEVAQEYTKRITDPPKLTSLAVSPQQVRIQSGTKQTFIAKGLNQYGKDILIQGVQWSATGGSIDRNGVFLAGADAGNFTVTATVETVSTLTTFAILTKSSREDGGKYVRDDQDDDPKNVLPKGLS